MSDPPNTHHERPGAPTTGVPSGLPGRAWPGWGLWLAVFSAAGFGASGVFGRSLLDAGWSPGAAVTARIAGAALAMSLPTAMALRGRWSVLRRHGRLILAYGAVSVAACQLFYFNAVTRLPVGVALLLEYLAPVLIIVWLWLRTGRRPTRLTLVGTAASVGGLALVLDLTGTVGIDPVGVAWGLAAAVCVATYFVLSARPAPGLPPIALAGSGMVVATVALVAAGLVGILPFDASTDDVAFAGRQVPWLVPVVAVALLSTALPYTAGIAATRRLGARLAVFLGLLEVLFAVLFAWLALDELPVAIQLVGGAVVLAGIVCIRYDELRGRPGVVSRTTTRRLDACDH